MGKIIHTGDIPDLETGWEGYSGEAVERLLRRTLSEALTSLKGKAGVFHYDQANNRYLVFADEECRDLYLENPAEHRDLLIANFEAPFNYSAEIALLSDAFMAVLAGSTGHYLEFTFATKNKSGQDVGEDVTCTFTFMRGSVKQSVKQRYRRGTVVRFNIDKYLDTGTNNITIGIVGDQTLAATTVGVTVQMVDLSLSDTYDVSACVTPAEDAQVEVGYTVSGYGAKVMEWYLDGVQLPYVKSEDEVTDATATRTKYIPLAGLASGRHMLQYRAYTVINGERFYSRMLHRDIMLSGGRTVLTAIGAELPLGTEPCGEGEALRLEGVTQYFPYRLRLGLFNPSYATSTPMEVWLGETLLTTLEMRNGVQTEYDLLVTASGEQELRLVADGVEYRVALDVTPSSASVDEITQGLLLALSASGKSNGAADRERWDYGDFRTAFEGFRWNETSGWQSGRLLISGGAAIENDCRPLASDGTATGKTLEFEFATRNVTDNDAVVCDLRNADGTGILITASEASLTSAMKSRISTRYKAGEKVRLSFVITRRSGTSDSRMALLYVDGILSGAADYAATDNFISDTALRIESGEGADVSLRSLRFYDTALSDSQILNNHILYQETAAEFMEVYDRNNVLEEGTSDLSTEALSGQLPVMIVTGNIPALEATTDKNLQIDVDVEYINLQDPERSFTLRDAAMRPQGTSSMSYPKKNFRLYTRKKDSTVLTDARGAVVADRLYAFRAGAQPVDCWCLKADYAESSGAHNTGIARIMNAAMRDAQPGGEYRCRTRAQQAAVDAGYAYDVRTAIDGFPILMFYRLTENDPLVFIGKYNFNNDKSTESVFGFRDIPGFDNSRMQCWELLTNGHHLALFTDTANWDAEWPEAFEGRYPDGNTDTADLLAFARWVSAVSAEDFAVQKHEHIDVYKMAAYYVYLMRFGAVDQVVKNSMLTSEDGVHWYFINYDNDTVIGLRNDGLLMYPPTIDRQTPDGTVEGVYAYAGNDSRLWNLLEGDAEFMETVREVDQAMYSAGLSYERVVAEMDEGQTAKWCERVYNLDARYKYLGPWQDRGINNLFMLQGSRRAHRRWWLSERFARLDAEYVSGEYKANSFEVKLSGAPAGLEFSVVAGMAFKYGYGVNNVAVESGVALEKGERHTFGTRSVLNVGDPLRIYAAPYLEEIDVSGLAAWLTQISIAPVYSERLDTKLERLVIGGADVRNTALTNLSGIGQAVALRELDIRGLGGLTSADLSGNVLLESLRAEDSGLTSATLPAGAPLREVRLPGSLQALTLDGLYALTDAGLSVQDNGRSLTRVEVSGCAGLDTLRLVRDWLTYKSAPDAECTLAVDGVDWSGVDTQWLIRLGGFRRIQLRGTVRLTEATIEELTALQSIYGNNCFTPGSELYIQVPVGIYIIGPDTVRGLQSARYEMLVSSSEAGTSSLALEGSNANVTFEDGVLTVADITSNQSVTLVGKFVPDSGLATVVRKTVTLERVVYPSTATLDGPKEVAKLGVYEYALTMGAHDADARYDVEWSLEGVAVEEGLVSLGSCNSAGANVVVSGLDVEKTYVLTAKVTKRDGTVLFSKSFTGSLMVSDAIITRVSNPGIMAVCYARGWAQSPAFMTAAEASAVTEIGEAFRNTSDTEFNAFQYFVNVLPSSINFAYFGQIKEISFPWEEVPSDLYLPNTSLCKFILVHFPRLKRCAGCLLHAGTGNTLPKLDAPLLEEVDTGSSDYFISGYNNSGINLNLPSLRVLRGGIVRVSAVGINLPLLETLDGVLSFKMADENAELNLPNLQTIGSRGQIGVSAKRYNLPKLTTMEGYCGSSSYGKEVEEIIAPLVSSFHHKQLTNDELNLRRVEIPNATSANFEMQSWETLEEIVAPKLETIDGTNSSTTYAVMADTSFIRNAKCIRGQFGIDLQGNGNFPNLEKIVGVQGYDKEVATAAIRTPTGLLKHLDEFNAPRLKVFGDTFVDCEKLTEVTLPYVTELFCTVASGCPELSKLNAPKVKRMQYMYNSYICVPFLQDCPKLETLDFPECTYVEMDTFGNTSSHYGVTLSAFELSSVKSLSLSVTEDVSCLGMMLYGSPIEKFAARLRTIRTIFYMSSYRNQIPYAGAPYLRELLLYGEMDTSGVATSRILAPSVGVSVPEGIEKIVHVPVDSTAYESSSVLYNLLVVKNGFTLVKDL